MKLILGMYNKLVLSSLPPLLPFFPRNLLLRDICRQTEVSLRDGAVTARSLSGNVKAGEAQQSQQEGEPRWPQI